MSKFTFICEEEAMPFADAVSSKRTVEFKAETISNIVNEFEMFLKGCGFNFLLLSFCIRVLNIYI